MAERSYDVCILGGGLAGLTLARQLRQRLPSIDIAVIEHRRFPVREAAHKVGESTVEIASHYLANQLGLVDHLRDSQLRKFGLRLFCRGERSVDRDLSDYDEIGPSMALPIPTYQLDRGRLENYLAETWRRMGELKDGTTVSSVELSSASHRVVTRDTKAGVETALRCRYLVDASGRRGLLRTHNRSGRSARHSHHAVWFRVEGRLDIDTWSRDQEWRSRCGERSRRKSTNHFTGPGYWLWLIPLASDTTSVGLVFDPEAVRLEDVRRREDLLKWLAGEHPLVASQIATREPIDHHVLQNYAMGNAQVFSPEGWGVTGDAGVFSDPFYSPGGDFIAFSNSYITEMIASATPRGQALWYQRYFQALFRNTISLYRRQYHGFGDRDLMVAKLLWDYAFYWSVAAKLYFSGKFSNLEFMRANEKTLLKATELHASMQALFRRRAQLCRRVGGERRFYDHHAVSLFHELQRDLLDGRPEDTATQLTRNVARLARLRPIVRAMLVKSASGVALPPLDQVQGFA